QDDNEVDIDLAYVTLKEMLYCPLTVTIGRQEIQLGAGFVMGDVDTNRTSLVNYGAAYAAIANRDLSLRKAFDAVRATLDYDPLIIDLIYSKIDENQKSGGIDLNDKNDIDLYAMNAKYTLGDDWGTMLEAYLLYRNDKTSNIATGTNSKTDTIWCPGLRAVSAPIKDLILTAEIAWQTGAKVPVTVTTSPSRQREAMAYQLTGSYALPFEKLKKYSPEVGGSYSFYSGEKNPTDVGAGRGNYEAWDQLYENQGTGKIYNVLFDTTNVRALGMNMSMVPMQDVKLKLEYTDLWLQKEVNATDMLTLYGIDGQISTPVMNQGANHLGREIDLTATYDYTEDVQFGLTYGAFLPGNAFGKGATPVKYDQNASQLIGTCSVSF
ncbi:MAG: hypothetical protein FJZ11_03265, partial [Candidatus Omnitrophica bacterium]|nr:hypothetical protein [Candidatus Omnitrophota bacterium]